MVGNFVLRRRASGAVKRNLRPQNRRFTSPNDKFECSYPHSNAFIHFFVCWKNVLFAQSDKCCELRKTKCQPMRSDFTWWRRISDSISQNIPSHFFLTLSSQTSRCTRSSIRILFKIVSVAWNYIIIHSYSVSPTSRGQVGIDHITISFISPAILFSLSQALPGVMGNRGIMSFISGEQGNTCLKMKGTGEQRYFEGAGNIEN